MIGRPNGASCSSASEVKRFSTKALPLMSGIEFLPEWLNTDAPIGVEEALPATAQIQIGADDCFDRVRDIVLAERRADDVADRSCLVARTAERDLVVLDA